MLLLFNAFLFNQFLLNIKPELNRFEKKFLNKWRFIKIYKAIMKLTKTFKGNHPLQHKWLKRVPIENKLLDQNHLLKYLWTGKSDKTSLCQSVIFFFFYSFKRTLTFNEDVWHQILKNQTQDKWEPTVILTLKAIAVIKSIYT